MSNELLRPSRTATTLRSYQHGKKIFLDSNYRLSPKYGFLFYVEFEFNTDVSVVNSDATKELGMIVKSCGLPKFSIDTKTHNAYNRKNIVQNKIQYDPISITFHDDQGDVVRDFWYDYYSYFYRDPDYADSTYNVPHKYQNRMSFDWGYSPRSATGRNGTQPYQYINAIRIYSLYQKQFSEYQLVNPVITSFKHGDHVNGDNGLLEHQMTVQFETVKYLTGYTTDNSNYVELHYDTISSPIAQATDSVPNGQGGYSQVTDAVTDLASSTKLVNKDVPIVLTPVSSGISNSFSSAFSTATSASTMGGGVGMGGTNFGGIMLPSLGTLTQGITNGAILNQQLQATATNLAGQLTNNLANGVIGGLQSGLGQNGGAIVNLAVAAIQNPQALVATATNMAAAYAMQAVSGKVTELAQGGINELSGWIKNQTGELTTGIANAFGDVGRELTISTDFLLNAPEGMSYDTFASGYFE